MIRSLSSRSSSLLHLRRPLLLEEIAPTFCSESQQLRGILYSSGPCSPRLLRRVPHRARSGQRGDCEDYLLSLGHSAVLSLCLASQNHLLRRNDNKTATQQQHTQQRVRISLFWCQPAGRGVACLYVPVLRVRKEHRDAQRAQRCVCFEVAGAIERVVDAEIGLREKSLKCAPVQNSLTHARRIRQSHTHIHTHTHTHTRARATTKAHLYTLTQPHNH